MLDDFIVPCLAAVVFARLASHHGQRAVAQGEESARVVPDHVGRGRLGAVQLSRYKTHTQATVNATRVPPKRILCTFQALVVSFAAYQP